MPGLDEQRSISRYGISSVTVVFDDDVDPYLGAADDLRAAGVGRAELLPEGVDAPELGP